MFDKKTDAARHKLDLISDCAPGLDLGRVTILPASILPEGDGERVLDLGCQALMKGWAGNNHNVSHRCLVVMEVAGFSGCEVTWGRGEGTPGQTVSAALDSLAGVYGPIQEAAKAWVWEEVAQRGTCVAS